MGSPSENGLERQRRCRAKLFLTGLYVAVGFVFSPGDSFARSKEHFCDGSHCLGSPKERHRRGSTVERSSTRSAGRPPPRNLARISVKENGLSSPFVFNQHGQESPCSFLCDLSVREFTARRVLLQAKANGRPKRLNRLRNEKGRSVVPLTRNQGVPRRVRQPEAIVLEARNVESLHGNESNQLGYLGWGSIGI